MKAKTKPRSKAKVISQTKIKAKAATAPKVKAKPKPSRRPGQKFTVSHWREEDFKVDGLRPYAAYRDLGIAKATNGMVTAHVIRHAPGATPDQRVSPRHFHDIQFQMVYVLNGWIRSEFEGAGEQTFKAGSCWIQPPGIKHKVLATSEDMVLLELIMPAEFDTVDVE
jgi:mannose-6-phosphate isomerase-like protein (cupin superfamily)